MKRMRALSMLCAAVLLFSLSACSRRELPPQLINPETTTAATAATTTTTAATTAATTTTTVPPTTTTTTRSLLPDPYSRAMSLETYLSRDRCTQKEDQAEYYNYYGYQNDIDWLDGALIREPCEEIFVYFEKFEYVRGEYTPDDLVKGNVYLITDYNEFVLLKDSRASTGSTGRLGNYYGYYYIALDNSIYRFRCDGLEKEILTFDRPIYAVSADAYAAYFLTDEGVYRLFLPTGQVDRLGDLPMTGITWYDISVASNRTLRMDLLTANGTPVMYYYCIPHDRWFDCDQMNMLYKEETGAEDMSDFFPWLQEYCEKNPA